MPRPSTKASLHELLQQARTNGLVLVVGAGINGKAAPQWNETVGELTRRGLLEASIEDRSIRILREELAAWCQRTFDPVALATLAKHLLGNGRYQAALQDIVYGITDEAEVAALGSTKSALPALAYLNAVAKLASRPAVRAVATFNFDTYLETAVNALGSRPAVAHFGPVKVKPHRPGVGGKQQGNPGTILPVYHVHGLLSSPRSISHSVHEAVVFAYDEYFGTNADPLAWETSTVIHLLRNYCTLWLGASMRDWNMLRLLHAAFGLEQANGQAYCLQALEAVESTESKSPPSGQPFVELAMRLQATLLAAVGARLIVAGNRFSELPDFLTKEITEELA